MGVDECGSAAVLSTNFRRMLHPMVGTKHIVHDVEEIAAVGDVIMIEIGDVIW